MFVLILFDFNTFSPYKNDLQAFLFSDLKGVFLANLGWIKTRHVNGKVSAKLAIKNSTLSC